MDKSLIPSLLQWFAHHPLGAATMVYAGGILGVLLYAYFEPREGGHPSRR